MCACDRAEAESFGDNSYLSQHPFISTPSARLPRSCSDLLLWCKRAAPPLQNNWLAHPLTQKATVFGRVHYSIGQPCRTESTHAPLPKHRNNADCYSYLTGAYLAQCIDCICLLKVFKNVHVAFFCLQHLYEELSHIIFWHHSNGLSSSAHCIPSHLPPTVFLVVVHLSS